MVDTTKIRINDLARELEVKSKAILDVLPKVGVTEKKTHSSSITVEEAEKVKAYVQGGGDGHPSASRAATRPRADEIKTKVDLSHISKPGDVLKALQQKAAPPAPHKPVAVPPRALEPAKPVAVPPAAKAAPTAAPPVAPAPPAEPEAPAPRMVRPPAEAPTRPVYKVPEPPAPPPPPAAVPPAAEAEEIRAEAELETVEPSAATPSRATAARAGGPGAPVEMPPAAAPPVVTPAEAPASTSGIEELIEAFLFEAPHVLT